MKVKKRNGWKLSKKHKIGLVSPGSLFINSTRAKVFIIGAIMLAGFLIARSIAIPRFQAINWDPELKNPCIKGAYTSDAKYCTNTNGKYWTLVVQSERDALQSCPGPNNQSFLVNSTGSPVSLNIVPKTGYDGNVSINLKTDLFNNSHPCGKGYFTFVGFFDNSQTGGGPLPQPNLAVQQATINYSNWTPAAAARLVATLQYWDNSKSDDEGQSKYIEINLSSTTNWGDSDPDPAIVVDRKVLDPSVPYRRVVYHYIVLDGRAAGVNITIAKGKDTSINIDWRNIIGILIRKGRLQPPPPSDPKDMSSGWKVHTSTQSIGLGTEVRNDKPIKSGVTDLWFSDWLTGSYSQASTILR